MLSSEYETMDFTEGFSTVLAMLPLQSDLKNILRNVIEECNQYGDFLDEDMIVTNVKVLSRNEIQEMLSKKDNARMEYRNIGQLELETSSLLDVSIYKSAASSFLYCTHLRIITTTQIR